MSTIRRMFTYHEKLSILSRHFQEGVSISELARVNKINPVTLYSWKRQMNKKNSHDEQVDIKKIIEENAKLKEQNKSLKKIIGEQVLDIDCLKDLNEFLKKKDLERLLKKPESSSEKTSNIAKKE